MTAVGREPSYILQENMDEKSIVIYLIVHINSEENKVAYYCRTGKIFTIYLQATTIMNKFLIDHCKRKKIPYVT